MNTRNQLFAIHMVIPFVLCTIIGAFIMPGWLPPSDPNMSLEDVARTFNPGNHSMRIGAMLCAVVGVLAVQFPAYFWLARTVTVAEGGQ